MNSDEESEGSELSNYSPNDDVRVFFQHQYQPEMPNYQENQMIYTN